MSNALGRLLCPLVCVCALLTPSTITFSFQMTMRAQVTEQVGMQEVAWHLPSLWASKIRSRPSGYGTDGQQKLVEKLEILKVFMVPTVT